MLGTQRITTQVATAREAAHNNKGHCHGQDHQAMRPGQGETVAVVKTSKASHLDDADAVGDLKGVVVAGEAHVSLLQAVGADEGVDLLALDLVHATDSRLDLALVGKLVDDEHQGVVVLDLLHRRLGGERVADDVVLVHTLQASLGLAHGLAHNLGVAGKREGLRLVEVGLRAHGHNLVVGTMAHLAAGVTRLRGCSLGHSA
mmetsp:Transcript_12349/g.18506  ORF Transcript_12349/g.18506 Transcript_12349/m.18506 type:complete len:202 (+) Transcript_12349:50-655(+)